MCHVVQKRYISEAEVVGNICRFLVLPCNLHSPELDYYEFTFDLKASKGALQDRGRIRVVVEVENEVWPSSPWPHDFAVDTVVGTEHSLHSLQLPLCIDQCCKLGWSPRVGSRPAEIAGQWQQGAESPQQYKELDWLVLELGRQEQLSSGLKVAFAPPRLHWYSPYKIIVINHNHLRTTTLNSSTTYLGWCFSSCPRRPQLISS